MAFKPHMPYILTVVRKATGQKSMRHLQQITVLTTGLMILFSCSLVGPRRQRIKEVGRQQAPEEILNTFWTLETFDNKKPDCEIIIGFLDKGQLVFKFQDKLYDGDYLWYIVRDSVINFHTRPLEKLAWTTDNCEMNPSIFALYIQGDKPLDIQGGTLVFMTFDNKKLRFKKL